MLQRARVLSGLLPILQRGTCSRTGVTPAYCTQATGDEDIEASIRQQLLEHAMLYVPKLGWTTDALTAAAKDLDLSPSSSGLFPRRESELIEHFLGTCNHNLNQQLKDRQAELSHLDTDARLHAALKLRLEMLQPHIQSWPQALAVLARPENAPHGATHLYSLVNDVWYAVGDVSTDTSWYTKRAALAAIYTSTELYMIMDYSPDFEDTWSALERRIKDADRVGDVLHNVGDATAAIMKMIVNSPQDLISQMQRRR